LAAVHADAEVATGHDDGVLLFAEAHGAFFLFVLGLPLDLFCVVVVVGAGESIDILDLERKPINLTRKVRYT